MAIGSPYLGMGADPTGTGAAAMDLGLTGKNAKDNADDEVKKQKKKVKATGQAAGPLGSMAVYDLLGL